VRTAAILPVKRFAEAKQRLGGAVAAPLRRELAAAMVGDVLAALAQAREIELTIVVTSEPAARAPAQAHGAMVMGDSAEAGQSAAVLLGVERALADGFQRVLCVPGDCPSLDPAEVDELLRGHGAAPGVVVVPDRHGTGTNGLLLTPPGAIEPGFGPDSCERHAARARAAGIACEIARVPSLLLDVDTGSDLAALRKRLAGERAAAAGTREVLAGASMTSAA
jgi:2-phospho-L-lactate guanylyltransferase